MPGPSPVAFLDLDRLHETIRDELDEAWDRTLRGSSFIGGEVSTFEAEFAAAHGRVGAAGCASGTDALSLALRAAGVGAGDEVVVPAMTFVATAEAVLHVAARPVVADVDPTTLLLTPDAVEAVRTPRTKAVLPVHLFGAMVEGEAIRAMQSGVPVVIEDAAQAHLAHDRDGRRAADGTTAACFSFFPGKNLGAFGDAGAVLSDDEELLARVRRTRDHGRTEKYVHDEVGVSSRLDGLQAAILRVKLRHLEGWTEGRRARAAQYVAGLAGISDLTVVDLHPGSARHLFPVRVPAVVRDDLRARLAEQGIQTGVHYPVPLTLQPAFRPFADAPAPNAERAADELVSLPLDPLMSEADVERVCLAVRSLLG